MEVMEVMRKIINCYFVCMYCKLYRSDTDKSSKSKPEQCLEFCEELEKVSDFGKGPMNRGLIV